MIFVSLFSVCKELYTIKGIKVDLITLLLNIIIPNVSVVGIIGFHQLYTM